MELVVLGTAQDGGLPHVGCERPCCARARRQGRELYPACLAVHDPATGALLLIEATPRIEPQLALLHELAGAHDRGRRPVDCVLLTHAHIGHYLGLAHFGKEVASTDSLPVFCSPRLAGFLRAHGPWGQLVKTRQIALHEVAPRVAFSPLQGLTVTAVPVPHRDEYSDTMAFKLRGPNKTVLFVPDIDSWQQRPGLLDELLDGVDVAYLDATFYDGRELPDRDLTKIRHPLMVDTMRRLATRAKAHPGALRFIHLNHTNPA
ncbi:MAG: MBL fold metallo-hydrolase, partial [Planctomycetes bacterium]|nr:MBL fold metallo-hydrolase [Planctomycetota bacterium]